MSFLKTRFLPWLAARLIALLFRTVRYEIDDPHGVLSARRDPSEPLLFAFWHNRILLMAPFYRKYIGRPSVVMISRSRDGEIIARTIGHFGLGTARGSTSKKGVSALREVIRKVEEGCDLGITPDGPRGPRGVVQPGIVQIAGTTGRPIVPLIPCYDRKRVLRSWDRFQVPALFARCRLTVGAPIRIPADLPDEALERACRDLEKALGE